MTTFNEIYGIGLSGLAAARSLAATASLNLANADNPDFARRVSDLSTGPYPGLAVLAGDPIAVRNPLLARALASTLGRLGYHEGRLDAVQLIESTFNPLDDVGLDVALDSFQDALTGLAASPGSTSQRQQVLDAAEALSAAFSSTRAQVQQASDVTVEQAQQVAVEVTAKAQQLAQLNSRIKTAAAGGADSGVLVDQRDALIQELGAMIDVQVIPQNDGTVRVFTNGGTPLVNSDSSATVAVSSVGPAPGYAVGITIQLGEGEPQAPIQSVGGQLGGLVAAHNDTVGPALGRLDELAYAYATAFNVQHQAGFGADGSTGLSFFADLSGPEGAAGGLRLSDALAGNPQRLATSGDAASVPGGNENVQQLIAVLDQPGVVNGLSVRGALDALSTDVSNAVRSAESGIAVEQTTAEQLQNLLLSETGVNAQEESLRLTQAAQALQAMSDVISTLNTMTDAILALV